MTNPGRSGGSRVKGAAGPQSTSVSLGDGLLISGETPDYSNHNDSYFLQIMQNLPTAVYTTDAEGCITFYNEAAASLWGRRPKLGEDWWCGSWRLYWPDGTPMAHDECPMAVTLKTGKPVRGAEAVAERPDGTRYPFTPYPTPLFDSEGKLVGALNMLVDITERKKNEEAAQRLAAIVESSDDAIVSKDLNGIIVSWNAGAARLFGYSAEEIVGKPVTTLIPPNHSDEEPTILQRLRRGERIDHYETVRQRKDGSLFDISLTVSPIKAVNGTIIGASKVARDITERKQAEATKEFLLNEIQHRVKNMLATVQAIASQTLKSTPPNERQTFADRIKALSRAYDLLTSQSVDRANIVDVVEQSLAVFQAQGGGRFHLDGPKAWLSANHALSLAMILHELGTNAAKYGALSNEEGQVLVTWKLVGEGQAKRITFCWRESKGPAVTPPQRRGFGSTLIERAFAGEQGKARIEFAPSGLTYSLEFPL